MRNKILALLGAIAIAAASTQFAAAGERQHTRKPARTSTTTAEQFRNANAAWIAQQPQPDVRFWGGWSAPAGH
jgi:hypothetical protein